MSKHTKKNRPVQPAPDTTNKYLERVKLILAIIVSLLKIWFMEKGIH